MGRPSEYTPEIARAICEKLAQGQSLRSICAAEDMPPESTVRLWALDDREGFAAQYARARELGYLGMADELLAISDDGSRDIRVDEGGNETVDHEVIARSRLRVDSRKWLLSKMLPKTFGDKVTQEHTGADGGPVRFVTVYEEKPGKDA